MKGHSIRLRLTAWYAAVLLVGLMLFGGGLWLALRYRLLDQVDGRLAERVKGLRTVLEIEDRGGRPRAELEQELAEFAREVPYGTLLELREHGGGFLLPSSDPVLAGQANGAGYRTVLRGGRGFRVLTAPFEFAARRYVAVVAAPLADVEVILRDFRNLLLMMIPGVLAVACLGGYWISRRALAPVDEITSVARSISVQNLSQRLAVPRTGDEIQRLSETWNEVLERLEAAVGRIRRFTADASHELRTPVALIRATAELALRRERQPERYREALQNIEAEASRMTELIESLLALARSDSSGGEMPRSPIDLNCLVADVVRQNAALADSRGIRLGAELVTEPAVAAANEPAVRRLLNILLENALRHTPAGGEIAVSTMLRGDTVLLAVRDTGEGISVEALPHIFERFYRADPARGTESGAGLGLSIARMIAHAHGSEIEVESAPGAGTCFRLALRN